MSGKCTVLGSEDTREDSQEGNNDDAARLVPSMDRLVADLFQAVAQESRLAKPFVEKVQDKEQSLPEPHSTVPPDVGALVPDAQHRARVVKGARATSSNRLEEDK